MSSAVSSFSGAVTSYKMGKEQKKAYKRQAFYEQRKTELETAYLEREARLMAEKRDEEIAATAAAMVRRTAETNRRVAETISTARARYGKSGVALSEGSSAEVLLEMSLKAKRLSTEELARMEYWKAKEQESYELQKRAMQEFSGYRVAELRRSGKLAFKAGQVGAWSGAIGGGMSIAASIIGGIGGAGGFAGGSAGSFASSFLGG